MLNDLEMPLQPPETGNEALSEVFASQIKYKKGTSFSKMIKQLDQYHGSTLGK
jgi:hypothetical protein